MTRPLEQAISEAKQLSEAEQDAIARLVPDEIESDRRWEASLARWPEKLSSLADRAWAEHEAGGSEPFDRLQT